MAREKQGQAAEVLMMEIYSWYTGSCLSTLFYADLPSLTLKVLVTTTDALGHFKTG